MSDQDKASHPGTQPACVHIATDPVKAELLVGVLEDAGIKAWVEGGLLQDPVAVSRRLMNLDSTRVLVAAMDLERAKEVLQASRSVTPEELEAQALAAGGTDAVEPPEAAPLGVEPEDEDAEPPRS